MRLSKPLFWLLTLFWFATSIWWYGSCSKCTTCTTETPAPIVINNSNLPGFSVADSSWSLTTADNLRFGLSGSTPVLATDITRVLDSLSVYGTTHPNKTITVTGYYKSDEKNNSTFENLGLARADELKKLLIAKGVNANNIITQSQMSNALVFNPADTLVGGITMTINTAAPKDDLFEPHTVYFNTAQNSLPTEEEFVNYIKRAKEYLQNNTDKKLMVTGHTDNVGNPEKNIQLSASRAVFVKNALTKMGIAADRITTEGKGMNEPIADNTTDEGRAKNRRVSIQLQ